MRSKQMWVQMKEAIIRLKNKNKPIRETAKAQIRISQKTSEQKNTWIEAKSLWFSHILQIHCGYVEINYFIVQIFMA